MKMYRNPLFTDFHRTTPYVCFTDFTVYKYRTKTATQCTSAVNFRNRHRSFLPYTLARYAPAFRDKLHRQTVIFYLANTCKISPTYIVWKSPSLYHASFMEASTKSSGLICVADIFLKVITKFPSSIYGIPSA